MTIRVAPSQLVRFLISNCNLSGEGYLTTSSDYKLSGPDLFVISQSFLHFLKNLVHNSVLCFPCW